MELEKLKDLLSNFYKLTKVRFVIFDENLNSYVIVYNVANINNRNICVVAFKNRNEGSFN